MAVLAVCTSTELSAQSLERAEKLVKHLQVLSHLQVWTHKRNCLGGKKKIPHCMPVLYIIFMDSSCAISDRTRGLIRDLSDRKKEFV